MICFSPCRGEVSVSYLRFERGAASPTDLFTELMRLARRLILKGWVGHFSKMGVPLREAPVVFQER